MNESSGENDKEKVTQEALRDPDVSCSLFSVSRTKLLRTLFLAFGKYQTYTYLILHSKNVH